MFRKEAKGAMDMDQKAAPDTIETPRLLLRRSRMEDWRDLYESIWSRPEAARYMFWSPTADENDARARMERTLAWEQTHPFKYTVEEKASGRAIGWAGVEPLDEGVWGETGVALGPEFWRRGYGREILSALCAFCRDEMGAERFVACAREKNEASNALIRAFGFVFDRGEELVDERNGESYTMLYYHKDLR